MNDGQPGGGRFDRRQDFARTEVSRQDAAYACAQRVAGPGRFRSGASTTIAGAPGAPRQRNQVFRGIVVMPLQGRQHDVRLNRSMDAVKPSRPVAPTTSMASPARPPIRVLRVRSRRGRDQQTNHAASATAGAPGGWPLPRGGTVAPQELQMNHAVGAFETPSIKRCRSSMERNGRPPAPVSRSPIHNGARGRRAIPGST